MRTAIIKTDFWKEDDIFELNSDTRLVYICLLTNPDRNTSPAFKCGDRMLSAYTGYNKDLLKICREQLIEKGFLTYIEGYYILNNQDYIKPKTGKLSKALLDKNLNELPLKVRVKALEVLKSRSRGALEYKGIYKDKDINKGKDNEEIKKIHTHYQKKIHDKSRIFDKGKKKIEKRLETYSEKELKKAIDKFSADVWWMKKNSRRGIAWFFHTDERIDGFLNLKEPEPTSIKC